MTIATDDTKSIMGDAEKTIESFTKAVERFSNMS